MFNIQTKTPLLFGTVALTAMAFVPMAHAVGSVEVEGGITSNVQLDTGVNVAIGADNKAGLSVGSVTGETRVGGDVDLTFKGKTLVNVAIGDGNKACMYMASVGNNAGCE